MADAITGFKWKSCSITPLDGGKAIELSNSIMMFDYFEDILQPNVTAAMTLVSSYSLVNEVPIRGGEKVDIELVSPFGSTACKAMYRCTSCLEPFEYFKCL